MTRKLATMFGAGRGKPGPYIASIFLTALLTLGGCAPRQEASPQAAPNPNLRMTLTVQPPAPRQLDPAQFTLTLKDAHGKPVGRAAVTLKLVMSDMDMGPNSVTLTPKTSGTYTGTGRFTMSGGWSVQAAASAGAATATQDFPVTVR